MSEPMTMSKKREAEIRQSRVLGVILAMREVDALRAEVERLKAAHASEMRRAFMRGRELCGHITVNDWSDPAEIDAALSEGEK